MLQLLSKRVPAPPEKSAFDLVNGVSIALDNKVELSGVGSLAAEERVVYFSC